MFLATALVVTFWIALVGRAPAQTHLPVPSTSQPTQSSATEISDLTREQIEKIVKDYLTSQEEKKKTTELEKKKQAESEGHVVGSDLGFKAFWSNQGLTFETASKDFRVHVGGRFDVDAAWFAAGQELQTGKGGVGLLEDGADFRRARVTVNGMMYEIVNWVSEFTFDTALEGQTIHPGFIDVYGEVTHLPWIGNVRAGHFREPFSMEALESGNGLVFMERSSGFEAFAPFRNVGVMLFNTAFEERVTWATGIFRTNSRNSGNPFDYGDGEWSSTSRITGLPWYTNDGQCLVHLGAAYSHRSFSLDPGQDQARFRSFDEVRVGRYIFTDTGNLTVESVDLLGLEFAVNLGPFCLQSELYHAWVHDAVVGKRLTSPQFTGGYIQASYFLTGESRIYRKAGGNSQGVLDHPRPYENFFLLRKDDDGQRQLIRGKGAWEIGVRYAWVDVNDPSEGINAQFAQDVTFGVNWYLNPHTRIQCNYIIIDRDFPAAGNSGVAHIFGTRFHMDF